MPPNTGLNSISRRATSELRHARAPRGHLCCTGSRVETKAAALGGNLLLQDGWRFVLSKFFTRRLLLSRLLLGRLSVREIFLGRLFLSRFLIGRLLRKLLFG